MKQKKYSIASAACLAVILSFALSPISLLANQQKQDAPAAISAKDKQTIEAFDKSVKAYVKMREGLEGKMPKLSKDSTPEQIEAHKVAFQESVRTARVGAKPGNVFTKSIANYIRTTIRNEFKGKDRQELRKSVMEAETQGVPLRVNYPYPENKELTEMPPTLLLKLPQLPKQLRYRFVGQHMLLVDRENGLILDYMLNAVP